MPPVLKCNQVFGHEQVNYPSPSIHAEITRVSGSDDITTIHLCINTGGEFPPSCPTLQKGRHALQAVSSSLYCCLIFMYITLMKLCTIGTRQEQTFYQRQDKIRTLTKDFYQRQDKIQIHRQEIIHHYKNTHIPLCQRSTALTSPNWDLNLEFQMLVALRVITTSE